MKIYQVGGAVRDMVLGKQPQDFDYVVVGSTIAEMQALGFKQVGRGFPVFLHPQTKDEYALARREIKTGPKHTDFSFVFDEHITLEDDLQRRDFTMNALARNPQTGEIIDFCGGVQDIKNRIIRHINSEHFVEDALRVFRMCRFAAQLDFQIAPETMRLAAKMVKADMLAYLPKERIWREFEKALLSNRFEKFILAAKECGALQKILPEVFQLWYAPKIKECSSAQNCGISTISALQQAAADNPEIKFALLVQDIGKTAISSDILPEHYIHELKELLLIDNICNRLGVPRKYQQFAKLCCKYRMKAEMIAEMQLEKLWEIVKDVSQNFNNKQQLTDFLQVCRCYRNGWDCSSAQEKTEYQKKAEQRCFNIFERAAKIKAVDMPNFSSLTKDARFGELFRQYILEQLQGL